MKLDLAAARRLLHLEASNPEPPPVEWVELIERLSEMCVGGVPRTHIAMLGTAILAKATDSRVDVFALKVSAQTQGAYSARNLAKEVLAAEAPGLAIDLGVTGREPLNNQPYFRETRITRAFERIVRGDGLPPFRLVFNALERLDKASSDEATGALRAFIQVRRRRPPPALDGDPRISALPSVVSASVREFVAARSESGKRAQAVAAALLDQLFGQASVEIARVNDPDRHFAGDVAVHSALPPYSIGRVYEVRDKEVADHDLLHFINKAYEHRASRAAVVCVAPRQRGLNVGRASDYAFARGVAFRIFHGWEELIAEVLFSSDDPPRRLLEDLGLAAYERLLELEVSPEGLALWRNTVRELNRGLSEMPGNPPPRG